MNKLIIFMLLTLVACQKSEKAKLPSDVKTITETQISLPTENLEGEIKGLYNGCGFNVNINKSELELHQPLNREIQEINTILNYTGIPSNFQFYSAPIDNAFAAIIQGKRYIIYDPRLFDNVDKTSNTYWSSMSILAHEIGHHLSGHTLNHDRNALQSELEADQFSGFILYKMGASLIQAKIAMKNLGSETDSDTHPSKYKRLMSIEKGWNTANSQRFDGAIPPAPHDEETLMNEFTKEMLINREYLTHESADIWYGEYDFYYGIIREVSNDKESFLVRVIKQENDSNKFNSSIINKDITVYIESTWSGDTEMCRACSDNLQYLLVPGRRIKFAIVEGCPGCGTAYNGMLSVSYIKFLNGNSF